jgi:hypothetical protein
MSLFFDGGECWWPFGAIKNGKKVKNQERRR